MACGCCSTPRGRGAGRPPARRSVHVRLVKRVPPGAGLGGGSSDAAAVLPGLEEAYGRAGADALRALAARLGSDVPFVLLPRASRWGAVAGSG